MLVKLTPVWYMLRVRASSRSALFLSGLLRTLHVKPPDRFSIRYRK